MKVRVLYDFIGQSESELSTSANDELTVVDQNVGEGWWEVKDSRGNIGLIPVSFVEVIDGATEMSLPSVSPTNSSTQFQIPSESDSDDDKKSSAQSKFSQSSYSMGSTHSTQDVYSVSLSLPKGGDTSRSAIIRKHCSKNFIKIGGENFLLNLDRPPNVTTEAITRLTDGMFRWCPVTQEALTATITATKKSSKLKGIKSFVYYEIETSISHSPISRRFKHFDWLHMRLVEKFPLICIPPIPDKSISSRFDETHIDDRRRWLQAWLNRMCAHPVVSNSRVFHHFLTCNVDSSKWKVGKREAESDLLQQGRFFYAIDSTDAISGAELTAQRAASLETYVTNLGRQTSALCQVCTDLHTDITATFGQKFSAMSVAIGGMSSTLGHEALGGTGNTGLSSALLKAAETYETLGKFNALRPKAAVDFIDILSEYSRLLHLLPEPIATAKSVDETVNILAKSTSSNGSAVTISPEDADMINAGAMVITRSVQAEVNHMMHQLREDYTQKFKAYLSDQALFFSLISRNLQEAADRF